MRLEHQHVHQRRLSVVYVARDHDVSDHRREAHHVNHEAADQLAYLAFHPLATTTHLRSNLVTGNPFSCTVKFRTLTGATIGSVKS